MKVNIYIDTDTTQSLYEGGITKIKRFNKRMYKSIRNDFTKLYPKPFNKRNAFAKEKLQ